MNNLPDIPHLLLFLNVYPDVQPVYWTVSGPDVLFIGVVPGTTLWCFSTWHGPDCPDGDDCDFCQASDEDYRKQFIDGTMFLPATRMLAYIDEARRTDAGWVWDKGTGPASDFFREMLARVTKDAKDEEALSGKDR